VGPDNRTLIEEDTGDGWRIVPSPNARNEAGSALNGVTCISVQNCLAVGYSDDKASTPTTLIEQNIGSGWTIVPSPNADAFGGIGSLNAVACTKSTNCIAVGRYESENGNFQTLIEQNVGDGWEVVPSPDIGLTEDNHLAAVTCTGQSLCNAVGSHGSAARNLPLIEQNSGSGWSVVPTSGVGALSGIACPGPDRCVATGGDFSVSASVINEAPLIEEMTDLKWATVALPLQVGVLGGVACPTPTYCISVGGLLSFPGGSAQTSLIAVERTGNGWTVSASGIVSQADSVTAVACADASRCIAVGDEFVGNGYSGVRATLIAQHTSQGWIIQASPNV
jgi:hypothetical protein